MIEKNECTEFLNEHVGIGIKNFYHADGGLFYYYGTLLQVTEEYAKLKLDKGLGYKQIDLDEIVEIKVMRRRHDD